MLPGLINFQSCETRAVASGVAADLLATIIRKKLMADAHAKASLVVSGGSTPGPCFDLLSDELLDWSRVTVVPSDERWVPVDHPDSNAQLINSRLLRGQASAGKLLPLFREGIEAAGAPPLIEIELAGLIQPFSAALLGMGEDGHFASLFPDFTDLQKALDPHRRASCILVKTKGSPHLRISLTLSALLNSEHIVLLIFGEAKRAVFEAACAGGSDYPVAGLINHLRTRLTVIWAP